MKLITTEQHTQLLANGCAAREAATRRGDTDNCMNNSNSPSNPTSSRVTLKLKAGARKSARESKTPPRPQSHSNNPMPGAHWSDEYKERMQADMDALTR
jgi:hypothetical protein